MKLEQQVCNLELAKKLKELGVKQESTFYWYQAIHEQLPEDSFIPIQPECTSNYDAAMKRLCSAFTVAELGEMLNSTQTGCAYRLWVCSSQIMIYSQEFNHTEQANTEANARAKMLIWLIENKHMGVK